MKIKKHQQNIYWGELKGASLGDDPDYTFLYGSTIEFKAPDCILFENRLMVSGQIIHEWRSEFHYQSQRLTPSLPLLKRGQTYQLNVLMKLYPKASVYLKIIFLDRYEKEISSHISKDQDLEFTYPKDAYSYRIQLLNAGAETIEFRYLTIENKRS